MESYIALLSAICTMWGVGENNRDTLAAYDAGVYLQFIGGILQS